MLPNLEWKMGMEYSRYVKFENKIFKLKFKLKFKI